MDTPKIFESEYRFCLILWEREPVTTTELVKLCRERLGWQKSTTYTVLKKLERRGFLKNERAVVTALVPRERVQGYESGQVVDRTFGGSLPAFVAAFTRERRLTREEAEAIQALIDRSRAEDGT